MIDSQWNELTLCIDEAIASLEDIALVPAPPEKRLRALLVARDRLNDWVERALVSLQREVHRG